MHYSDRSLEMADGNLFRPYTTGMSPHDTTIATILLYTDKAPGKDDIIFDYFSNFQTKVQNIKPEAKWEASKDMPDYPSGKIPNLDQISRGNNYYGIFNNFSLLSVIERQAQIVKIQQTFSGFWNAFFFGEQPRVYNFSGFFIDSLEYPYFQEFMTAYEKYLAGRKCVENKMIMKIIYDGRIIDGYMMNMSMNQDAGTPYSKAFNFDVLVRASGWIRINKVYKGNGAIGNEKKYLPEMQFNGLSNEARMVKYLQNGTIDAPVIEKDTSSKNIPANPVEIPTGYGYRR